jgi:glutamate-5-semialdehyde dehydrogenase
MANRPSAVVPNLLVPGLECFCGDDHFPDLCVSACYSRNTFIVVAGGYLRLFNLDLHVASSVFFSPIDMAADSTDSASAAIAAILAATQQAASQLSQASYSQRQVALKQLLENLRNQQNQILEANTLDLEASREMAIAEVVQTWLKLTPERLQATAHLLEQLIALPDPLGVWPGQTRQYLPLGVIALIYEAFPSLALLMAGMTIKTGNALLLRGGNETLHGNGVALELIQSALAVANLPVNAVTASQQSLKDLLAVETGLDLVIPYGRPALVQQVVRHAVPPVLPTAIGNCYLYWSPTGSTERVRTLILDSHMGEPEAVNAIEKVLVHEGINRSMLSLLFNELQSQGFELRGADELVAEFPELKLATELEWGCPYLRKVVAFRLVSDVSTAITQINTHSAGHADSIISDSYLEVQQFSRGVNSAYIYVNRSPRFCRGQGEVSLGICGRKGYQRGVINLNSLLTDKQVLQ